MRVMLDTNILISSFIFKSSKINELINELTEPKGYNPLGLNTYKPPIAKLT